MQKNWFFVGLFHRSLIIHEQTLGKTHLQEVEHVSSGEAKDAARRGQGHGHWRCFVVGRRRRFLFKSERKCEGDKCVVQVSFSFFSPRVS